MKNTRNGNVQITAYNTNNRCGTLLDHENGTAEELEVVCFNKNGINTDTPFTLSYQVRSGITCSSQKGLAYLLEDPTARTGGLLTQSYNSTGNSNTVVRNSAGRYTVTIPGLTKTGGNVQVTELSLAGC